METYKIIYSEAEKIPNNTPKFFDKLGYGIGNKRTTKFEIELREILKSMNLNVISEKKISNDVGYRFDYYIPEENTVVEIALSANNANTEFEKDIFKVLLFNDANPMNKIEHLVLIGKNGIVNRLKGNGPSAIRNFVKKHFNIQIDVLEINIKNSK